ncbi:MAG: GspH/FimT family pseudopilin [Candidatus Vogelbacteria bacterium]|nr:GspH/FimT family pseudopilin [Candidatus Vogelbacteria bacterium]
MAKTGPALSLSKGFTLIEIVLALGLIVFVAGFALTIDYQRYQKQSLKTEQQTIITLLQTARSQAINNIGQSSHGLVIYPPDEPQNYVLFTGTDYSTSDPTKNQIIESGYNWDLASTSLSQVIFNQLSGDVNTAGEIILIDPVSNNTSTISVNHEGAINW